MAKLGGSVDELQADLLQIPLLGVSQEGLKKKILRKARSASDLNRQHNNISIAYIISVNRIFSERAS